MWRTREKWLIGLYLCAAVLNLYAEYTHWTWGIWLSKPLLMIGLLIDWIGYPLPFTQFARLISIGFVFSLMGDVFLMLVSSNLHPPVPFFILGLASFLLTHVSYLSAFLHLAKGKKGWVQQKSYRALPLMGLVGLLLWFIWPGLDTLQVPVFVYAMAIMIMAIGALNLRTLLSAKIWQLLFGAVLFFVLSDGLIAINKFRVSLGDGQLLIMLTYIIAQAGIFYAGIQIRETKTFNVFLFLAYGLGFSSILRAPN